MAIDKLTSPQALATSPNDWIAAVNLIEKLYLGHEIPVRIDYDNDLVLKGSVFQIGGSVYIASADTSITGTPSDYVKIIPGVSTATAAYVANLTGVTWNDTYNGYYDVGGNFYIFDEDKAYYEGVITDVYKSDGKRAVNASDYIDTTNTSFALQRAKFNFVSNSDGGTATSGAWRVLSLTEYFNFISGCSISSNQITLPAGKYYLTGHCMFYAVNACAIRIYDITNTALLISGSGNTLTAADFVAMPNLISGYFELSSSVIIEFQYQVQTTRASTGLGACNGLPIDPSEFRALTIEKIG